MSAARVTQFAVIVVGVVALAAWQLMAGPAPEQSIAASEPERDAKIDFPAFLIRPVGAKGRSYATGLSFGPDAIRINDQHVEAIVRRIESNLFELTLTPKEPLSEVWFPWPHEAYVAGSSDEDDWAYYPYIMGMRRPARDLQDWAWKGVDYPGPLFAPLMVLGDDREAMFVAAANWPPRPTTVFYCKQRLTLRYRGSFPAGQTIKLRTLVGTVSGDAAKGEDPWRLCVERYRAWLDPHLEAEHLWPPETPAYLRDAHGWINVQLENFRQFDAREVLRRWQELRPFLNWVQCWGQMSHYAGPTELAIPRRPLDEEVGCCLDKINFHPRYLPDLPEIARRITTGGGRFGYYARPAKDGRLDAPTGSKGDGAPDDWSRLLNWIEANTRQGANAYYIDVLAGGTFGDPLTIARRIRDDLPKGVVLEYAKDIYPAAFLISGCLMSKSKDADGEAFPRFGRSLLSDRYVFLGESNGDFLGWGADHDYATERQAFLLGAKFDAISPWASGYAGNLNPVMRRVIEERDRVNWWKREPVYRDRAGLAEMPAGVDARRFIAADGATLIAFDNPRRLAGRTVFCDGRSVAVPIEPIAIVEIESPEAGVSQNATSDDNTHTLTGRRP
ncbi:MAG: hypothetical protein KDA32_08230 [Phycisphaerales bacterium]|nr:hypothetical protein [Phycisphaerales bacterium]